MIKNSIFLQLRSTFKANPILTSNVSFKQDGNIVFHHNLKQYDEMGKVCKKLYGVKTFISGSEAFHLM